jgi:hypothetical protein
MLQLEHLTMALYCPRMKPLLRECLLSELALEIEHIKPARTAHALKEITPLAQVEKRKSNKNRYLIIGAVFRSSPIGFCGWLCTSFRSSWQPPAFALTIWPFSSKVFVIHCYNPIQSFQTTHFDNEIDLTATYELQMVSRKSDIEVIAVKHIVL